MGQQACGFALWLQGAQWAAEEGPRPMLLDLNDPQLAFELVKHGKSHTALLDRAAAIVLPARPLEVRALPCVARTLCHVSCDFCTSRLLCDHNQQQYSSDAWQGRCCSAQVTCASWHACCVVMHLLTGSGCWPCKLSSNYVARLWHRAIKLYVHNRPLVHTCVNYSTACKLSRHTPVSYRT